MTQLAALLVRHQPSVRVHRAALAGLGGALTIGLLGLLATTTGDAWLAAPVGASCVLVFTMPSAPVSQPVNVVGGHLVSAAIGLVVAHLLPAAWWSTALAVGLAITAMAALRVTHPPAGANPVVIVLAGAGWGYLVAPILVGAIAVVAVGLAFHRLAAPRGSASPYPLGHVPGTSRG